MFDWSLLKQKAAVGGSGSSGQRGGGGARGGNRPQAPQQPFQATQGKFSLLTTFNKGFINSRKYAILNANRLKK